MIPMILGIYDLGWLCMTRISVDDDAARVCIYFNVNISFVRADMAYLCNAIFQSDPKHQTNQYTGACDVYLHLFLLFYLFGVSRNSLLLTSTPSFPASFPRFSKRALSV